MKRLRELREGKHLSRDALARKAGVSSALIVAHEKGKNHDTLVSVAYPLAQALGVPLEDLFSPEDMALQIKEGVQP